ncbi:MAG: hypothetical protein C0501_10470 [Isosphaera sp.]|nr:hypothetical protein [Isosphaera sp.]
MCRSMVLPAALLAAATPAAAGPISTDIWDISQGVVVTAQSGVVPTSSARNLLGAAEGTVEAGNVLFRDDRPAGFVHFVEWRTPVPVLVTGFNLFAIHDGAPFDANERGFRRFTLLARDPATGDFGSVFEFFPTNPYTQAGPDFLLVAAALAPLTAQEFRAEFEQFGDRTPPARGPRVIELDGFGSVAPGTAAVPEPATALLLATGAGVAGAYARGRARGRRPAGDGGTGSPDPRA